MQTALRKMGNSTGMIVPKALLNQMGLSAGAAVELRIEDGKLIASPVRKVREGWAEAAAQLAAAEEDPDEAAWSGFGNESDEELRW